MEKTFYLLVTVQHLGADRTCIEGRMNYDKKEKVIIDFDRELMINLRLMDSLYIKKQPTLEELIAIKPRLCWVCYKNKKFLRLILNVDEFGFFVDDNGCAYDNSQMLTDDEIKQFLNGE